RGAARRRRRAGRAPCRARARPRADAVPGHDLVLAVSGALAVAGDPPGRVPVGGASAAVDPAAAGRGRGAAGLAAASPGGAAGAALALPAAGTVLADRRVGGRGVARADRHLRRHLAGPSPADLLGPHRRAGAALA